MVADCISKRLGERFALLQGEILRDPCKARFHLASGERLVWVFPIYSWGVPPIVERFIASVGIDSEADDNPHYLVCTCGDDIGNAHRLWRKMIAKRGWKPAGAYSVQMPNIYVLMKGFDVDSSQIEQQKLSSMPDRVEEIARKILSGNLSDDVVRGSWPWVKSALIRPWFRRHAMSPKPFHATSECSGCGKCASSCPMGNITIGEKTFPVWGEECALCLRCYHICPSGAVAYGKATVGKGRKKVYAL